MKRKYPKHKHLLGCEIEYRGKKCFVAGIDSRKGITIDYIEPKYGKWSFGHAMCLHSPSLNYDNFHRLFCIIVDFIEGKRDIPTSAGSLFGSTDNCPFK